MSFSLMMAPFLLFFHMMTGQVQLSIIHYTAAAKQGCMRAGCRNQGLGGHLTRDFYVTSFHCTPFVPLYLSSLVYVSQV
jgi:hypothetical protein